MRPVAEGHAGNRSKGAAAVEFALLAPLLFVLLFGIVEIGLMLYDKAIITNASREAARAGIVMQRRTLAELQGVADNFTSGRLVYFGATPPTVSVVTTPVDPKAVASGEDLIVTIGYHYDFLVLASLLNLVAASSGTSSLVEGVDLVAETRMRAE